MDRLKALFKVGAIGAGLVLASTAAEAKGCIKGAIVGGLGGHYVGRGMSSLEGAAVPHGTVRAAGHWPTLLGAVAGCLGGRYVAHRRVDTTARPAQPSPSRSAQTPATHSQRPPALGSAQALRSRSIQPGRSDRGPR
jgi:hypothetical protein